MRWLDGIRRERLRELEVFSLDQVDPVAVTAAPRSLGEWLFGNRGPDWLLLEGCAAYVRG